ncbi:hypothetical protein T484DRAFT_1811745, partial [Baffinella frigidus]
VKLADGLTPKEVATFVGLLADLTSAESGGASTFGGLLRAFADMGTPPNCALLEKLQEAATAAAHLFTGQEVLGMLRAAAVGPTPRPRFVAAMQERAVQACCDFAGGVWWACCNFAGGVWWACRDFAPGDMVGLVRALAEMEAVPCDALVAAVEGRVAEEGEAFGEEPLGQLLDALDAMQVATSPAFDDAIRPFAPERHTHRGVGVAMDTDAAATETDAAAMDTEGPSAVRPFEAGRQGDRGDVSAMETDAAAMETDAAAMETDEGPSVSTAPPNRGVVPPSPRPAMEERGGARLPGGEREAQRLTPTLPDGATERGDVRLVGGEEEMRGGGGEAPPLPDAEIPR